MTPKEFLKAKGFKSEGGYIDLESILQEYADLQNQWIPIESVEEIPIGEYLFCYDDGYCEVERGQSITDEYKEFPEITGIPIAYQKIKPYQP